MFVIDDEKYISLSAPQMPENHNFWSKNNNATSSRGKNKFKKKFEPKMCYGLQLGSPCLAPYFKQSSLAIRSDTYIKECLWKRLLPFIKEHHSSNNYWFWPNKVDTHYSNETKAFLVLEIVNFVPREWNSTNLPRVLQLKNFLVTSPQKSMEQV